MEKFFESIYFRLLRPKPIVLFYFVIILFVGKNYNTYLTFHNNETPFTSDSDQYYSYLPATFIHKDLSFKANNRYWDVTLPNGNNLQRFTCGVAIMELPFFVMGHYYAKTHGYILDGYSAPYVWFNYFGVFFYVLLGLLFLYKSLRFYFDEWFCVFILCIIFLATNLFFYTVSHGQMSHSFLFLLQAVFLFHLLRWSRNGKWLNVLVMSAASGMAVLVRPSEVVILLLPLLIGIKDKETFFKKIKFFAEKKWQILAAALVFLTMLTPQMLYWKYATGDYLYYSYHKEGFFFSDPKIFKFLFGYRKGLIPYSPIMIFSIIGFFFLWKKHKEIFWAIFIFNMVNIYFLSCWWDYGFGGGLGNRAMVQSYTSLAFPLAAFFGWFFNLFKNKNLKYIPHVISIICLVFCIKLNLLMTKQFCNTILHWSGMNKETYWWIWGRDSFTNDDYRTREAMIKQPDFEKMQEGKRD